MSEQKMREALECIVERFSPIESTLVFSRRMAIKKCREALSQREAQEPFAWATHAGINFVRDKTSSRADNASLPLSTSKGGDHTVAVYTAPPSREAPEEWVEVMRGLVECARDELVRCEGMKCREPNCISCNDEQEAFRSIERSRELVYRARALLASKGGVE